jgi:hypothetical protein
VVAQNVRWIGVSFWVSVLEVAVGVVAGGFVNWLFSRRGSKELRGETRRLRQIVTLLALYMQKDGLLRDVELDEHGNLKGFAQTVKLTGVPSEEVVGRPEIKKGPHDDNAGYSQEYVDEEG